MFLKRAMLLFSICYFSSDCYADEELSPPDIRNPQNSYLILERESEPLNIPCNATGLPSPTYEWKKGDVGDSTTLSGDVSFNSNTGVLSFKSLSHTNEGEYRCYATNRFDGEGGRAFAVSISPPVEIRIIKYVVIAQEEEELQAKEYSYIQLVCKNPITERRGMSVYWFKGNSQDVITQDDRIYIDKYGNLHISYLLKQDEDLKGMFCGVTVTGKMKKFLYKFGNTYKLKITSANQVPHIAPQLEYSENVLGDIHQSAQLECVFSGYDPQNNMTITWITSDGKKIQSNEKYNLQHGNRTLEIKNVVENDEGKYYCSAKIGSQVTKEKEIVLDVAGKPYFLDDKAAHDVTVSEGRDITIPCEARSPKNDAPPSPPVWFINGQPLGSQADSNKIVVRTNSLTIKSVKKPDDIMCIACVVANSLGKIMGEACVNVLLPIKVVKTTDLKQQIDPDVGTLLNFTVIATTDISQSLNYKWTHYKDREDYVGGEPKFTFYDRKTRVAYINTTGMLEAEYEAVKGFYKLNISHFYDYVTLSFHIQIKGQSDQEQEVSDHWIVYFVIGIVLIIISFLLLFTMFRKQQEKQYKGESEL